MYTYNIHVYNNKVVVSLLSLSCVVTKLCSKLTLDDNVHIFGGYSKPW